MSTTVPTHRHGGCRSGRPAVARPVAIDDAVARRAGPTEPDPAVLALLDTLSRDAVLADLATLAAHPTRRSESAGTALEAVTPDKVARLRGLVGEWLKAHPGVHPGQVRLDVVAITLPPRGPARVQHVRGVF